MMNLSDPLVYRENLEQLVKNFLYGPFLGEGEILDTNPLSFYSTGILFPEQYIGSGNLRIRERENGAEIDIDSIDSDSEPRESNEEENFMEDMPGHFRSAIGITFCIQIPALSPLKINIEYSKYVKLENETGKFYREEKTQIQELLLDQNLLTDSEGEFLQLGEHDDFKLTYLILKKNESELVITVNMRNVSPILNELSKEEINEKWNFDRILPYTLFRSKIRIDSTEGFLPLRKSLLSFNEDVAFEMLFQERITFCAGVNIAADSTIVEGRCYRVESEYIPRSEQKVLDTEINKENQNSKDIADLLKITSLLENPDVIPNMLISLSQSYEHWIESTFNSDSEMKTRCKVALKRIENGIARLREKENVRSVFCDTIRALELQNRWNRSDNNAAFSFRPFQLAFLLMIIPDILDGKDSEFYDKIDLLWIPTGGGKTEAYLAVSGFTILWNRLLSDKTTFDGRVSILTRYTLRLLTTQQFQRSARMILALDQIRYQNLQKYGSKPISIGILVGSESTPNSDTDYQDRLENWREDSSHPFPLAECPICKTKLTNPVSGALRSIDSAPNNAYFYKLDRNEFNPFGTDVNNNRRDFNHISCPNQACSSKVNGGYTCLPVYFVDDDIFAVKPDFILATVDKFAMINFRKLSDYQTLFSPPPSLILQDELHLINSTLGTIFANYEAGLETLWNIWNPGFPLPKVITSTATPKNSEDQIQFVFGRQSLVFPPGGATIEDFYFSRFKEDESGRHYIGYMASGMPEKNFERDISSAILAARIILIGTLTQLEERNTFMPSMHSSKISRNYKVLVSYFNDLKELGGYTAMVEDDIRQKLSLYLRRFIKGCFEDPEHFKDLMESVNQNIVNHETETVIKNYETKGTELTSRLIASQIQEILNLFSDNEIEKSLDYPDVISATNMISVGIDIEQFNTMLVCGQPKSASEYIQSTSRVGRILPGMVFVSHNPNKLRDSNHYQFFEAFHKAFYKYSDPSTVSPYSKQALKRCIPSQIISLIETRWPDLARTKTGARVQARRRQADMEFRNIVNSLLNDFEGGLNSWDDLRIYTENQVKRFSNLNPSNFGAADGVGFRKNFIEVIQSTLGVILRIVNSDLTNFETLRWVFSKYVNSVQELNTGVKQCFGVDYAGFFLLDLPEDSVKPFPIPTSMRNVDTPIDVTILIPNSNERQNGE